MNRKQRRELARTQKSSGPRPTAPGGANFLAAAQQRYDRGEFQAACDVCKRLLAHEPAHINALNLLGLSYQGAGRHLLAIKTLSKAVALDGFNAACHYNLAASHLASGDEEKAAFHFKRSISLGLSGQDAEQFLRQSAAVLAAFGEVEKKWPFSLGLELFRNGVIQGLSRELFFRCALEEVVISGVDFERLLSQLRTALLQYAVQNERAELDESALKLFCSLAQQCFMTEYVSETTDKDKSAADALRSRLERCLAQEAEFPQTLVVAVASCAPLVSIAGSEKLLHRGVPPYVAQVLRQQIREPLEERADIEQIPRLTKIESPDSHLLMQQYSQNPYPRWATDLSMLREDDAAATSVDDLAPQDILIAGCGTGQHACQLAREFPNARILAVDLSLPSLAYARRKTREAGLTGIEYGQADILEIPSLGRTFDIIEAVGVLHHMADPARGWEALLSVLRPEGHMRIGLYSEIARRAIVELREYIRERAYTPAAEDIRKCRQELQLKQEQRWKFWIGTRDFHSVSGCRDMLFNVIEHRFTIAQLREFLTEHRLTFLGFELEPHVAALFKERFPIPGALLDLASWERFEAEYPSAFRSMYQFTVRAE